MKFEYPAGATPLDPDEAVGLIPEHINTQSVKPALGAANRHWELIATISQTCVMTFQHNF